MNVYLPVDELQASGLATLSNLSSTTPENRTKLISLGVIKLLISSMKLHLKSAGVQEYGLLTLLNLCHEDKVAETLMKQEICKLIKDSMETHLQNARVHANGLGALNNLCNKDDAVVLAKNGIGKLVIKSMKANLSDAKVQDIGLRLLANLACDRGCAAALMQQGDVDKLIATFDQCTDELIKLAA